MNKLQLLEILLDLVYKSQYIEFKRESACGGERTYVDSDRLIKNIGKLIDEEKEGFQNKDQTQKENRS